MRLVVLFILLTTIHLSYSEDYHQEFDDVLRKGIMFNEESRILLAEKFIPIQFLVPFPKYNFSMKTELTELLKNLNNKWKLPSTSCPLEFSTSFKTNTSSYNVDWILNKIQKEVLKSKSNIDMLRNETATFLQNDKEVMQSRQRRGAHVGALAMAGIGLFGSGLMMGGSAGCGLTGIFGSCQDQAKTNAANIEHLSTITTTIVDYVAKMQTTNDEKFFVVSNKLAEIEEAQQQMTETQNNNWKIIEEQFQAITPISTCFEIVPKCFFPTSNSISILTPPPHYSRFYILM